MKTANTIPWEAVVEGCPSSKARCLPLVVSQSCANFDPSVVANLLASPPAGRVEDALMAMASRSNNSTLLELLLHQPGSIAQLTSDGKTSVILQTFSRPLSACRFASSALSRDAFARTYVARYARFDADARAFITSDPIEEDDGNANPRYEFLNPTSWGFSPTSTKTSSSMHWTAHNLFRSPTPPKAHVKPSHVTRQRFKDIFEEPTIDRGDPFQCIPQLRQLKTICERSLTAVHAHDVALSLGRCRLFGVKLADTEDFTLTPAAFERAAAELIDLVKGASRWATQLETTADSYSPYLHRNLALELLEIRMDAHAAYFALDEAYAAGIYECEPAAEMMGRRLNQVRRVISLFDGNLQKQIPLLRLAASTFLLENWRRLLAPAYRDLPPWWLDGCLE